MITGASKNPPKSNALVRALALFARRGDQLPAAPVEEHNEILQHLGAAVMMRWNSLPREVQRCLFDAAVGMDEPDAEIIRQHIAIFLHHHKNDSHGADVGGEA